MNRATKFSLVVLTSGSVMLSALAGVSAQPASSKSLATKVTKPVTKPVTKVVPAKTAAEKKAAAKKAATKRLAAKKAAAKKAAAKRLAAKKAATKKAAAKALALKKAAAKKVAAEKVARKTLLSNILDSLTPDVPTDTPEPNPYQSEGADWESGDFSASQPLIRCTKSLPPHCDFRPGNHYGKPTAQLLAFHEAMMVANNEYFATTNAAYEAFATATSAAQETFNQSWFSAFETSPAAYMQNYLDYVIATRDPQIELNALNLVANQALTEARYVALADFDAATYDAQTESGASAFAAISEYRNAAKALELEQFATNQNDSVVLNDGVIERMQAYLDVLATLEDEDDINAASNTYYSELSELYLQYSINSNELLAPFYEAQQSALDAFVALTGDKPVHPHHFPYWYFGDGYPIHPVDPLPPVDGEDGSKDDEDELVYCMSLDCPRPDRPMPVDPTVIDEETSEPEIAICPPPREEEIFIPVAPCPPHEYFEYPVPVPSEPDAQEETGSEGETVSPQDSESAVE